MPPSGSPLAPQGGSGCRYFHRGREVGGAYENAIGVFDTRNLFEPRHRLRGFDCTSTQISAFVLARLCGTVPSRPPRVDPDTRGYPPADTALRAQQPPLAQASHARGEQGVYADVEELLDQRLVVPGGPSLLYYLVPG